MINEKDKRNTAQEFKDAIKHEKQDAYDDILRRLDEIEAKIALIEGNHPDFIRPIPEKK